VDVVTVIDLIHFTASESVYCTCLLATGAEIQI